MEAIYPELSEQGQLEALKIIDDFKEKLKKANEDVLSDLYCNVMPYIESDTWSNFRNQILDGFKDYKNSKIHNKYDFKQIRRKMFDDYKDEIIKDLNNDILEENEFLKKQVKDLQECLRTSKF